MHAPNVEETRQAIGVAVAALAHSDCMSFKLTDLIAIE
jgi:hypothetical protein